MKNVLCPVDLSDVSRHALAYATAFSVAHGSRLRVLYVVDAFPGGRTESDARGDLEAFLGGHKGAGHSIEAVVVTGDPKKEILHAATSELTDYIVMGTHGRGGFERFVIGSVTEHVLRKSKCPVLAVPPGDRKAAADGLFRTVVCAVDFAPASVKALDHAEWLTASGGRWVLVHSISWPFGEGPGLPPEITALRATMEADAKDRMRALICDRRKDIQIDLRVDVGKPYAHILRAAEDVSADVIVGGLHSHATSDLALLGSTTRRVLHEAPCPVLTVGEF
jgi:nucleotide-binding universal stress UspA family protein